MNRFFATATLGTLALARWSVADAQTNQPLNVKSSYPSDSTTDHISALPPAPIGTSTIIGGAIRNVDPVRDQFSLQVFGEKPMKILYDERTQVYRDGVRLPLRNLGPEDHTSVQTVLDGANVFALSIHILSQAPQGQCQGQVLSFDPATGQLQVSSTISPDPIELVVPPNTLISRVGQSTFSESSSGVSDLTHGTLVAVTFQPVRQGRAVVNQISILATPGSTFVFAGEISYLDFNTGQADLLDTQDQKSYQIVFNSTEIPASRALHLGDHVRVTARYEGSHYRATSITNY